MDVRQEGVTWKMVCKTPVQDVHVWAEIGAVDVYGVGLYAHVWGEGENGGGVWGWCGGEGILLDLLSCIWLSLIRAQTGRLIVQQEVLQNIGLPTGPNVSPMGDTGSQVRKLATGNAGVDVRVAVGAYRSPALWAVEHGVSVLSSTVDCGAAWRSAEMVAVWACLRERKGTSTNCGDLVVIDRSLTLGHD